MDKNYLTPAEITDTVIETGIKKSQTKWWKLIILGILAGAFIAFAAEASSCSAYGIENIGLGKTLGGAIFATGLMMVLLAGGELFTGNCLIIISVLDKKNKVNKMLLNWIFVFLGNLIGSLLIAYLIIHSTQFNYNGGMLGGYAIKTAVTKTSLPFISAFYMGILCNWIVCIAVWLCYGAKDMAGKILAIFFPIWLFITSGFEHCVADMYYIPVGIMAKSNETWAKAATELFHITSEGFNNLTWVNFFVKSLVPVTLGNIIGGGLFVGVAYYFVYKKK